MAKTLIAAGDNIDILTPVDLKINDSVDESVKNVIALHKKTGFDTFMLTAPSKGWRSIGYPPPAHFEEIAADILRFKEGLRGYDIRVGWWNTLTLKTGAAEYQRIVNIDGQACRTSTCPLDDGYQARFSGDVALVAEKANPCLIIFEDDFGLNCHNGFACFCDLHLRRFAEQTGRFYAREELRGIFARDSKPAIELRLEWAAMSRDSMASLAAKVRQAVDRKTPLIPIGSMQPGCADADGDTTEPVARALAGPRHRPFVRLFGTSYANDDSFSLPRNVFHALYGKQHLPDDFICYHESDTYPHNRFFMSAGKMRALMGAIYSYGFDGSTFQVCQHLDNPNEETGYHEMFMRERKRFRAARNLARQCEISGCGLLTDPMGRHSNADANQWVSAFAHFGMPYTTRESRVNALSGTSPNSLNDGQIEALLGKGLLLDGEAAAALCARGFGAALGVSVAGKEDIHGPGRDLEGRERIRAEFLRGQDDGRQMTWYSTFSPYGNGELFHLTPACPDVEIVTDLLDFRGKPLGIGMTRFRNSHGGRVVVMGMSVKNNLSSSLFNYRRRRLIQDLLIWAGADDLVHVRDRPKVFCVFNRPRDEAGGMLGLVTLINLCSDTFESVELYIPDTWRGKTRVMRLDMHGVWQAAAHEFAGHTAQINHKLPLYQPLFLRFVEK